MASELLPLNLNTFLRFNSSQTLTYQKISPSTSEKRSNKSTKNDSVGKSTTRVLRSGRLIGAPASRIGSRTRASIRKKTSKEIIEISSSNNQTFLNDVFNETRSDRQFPGKTHAKETRDNESQSPIATQNVPNIAPSIDKL
ncbi:putative death-inducer obliterator 1 isoform X1 [Sesbania bispinosa]|nr:putative death-inducer obliterator 1 isoform X1 [Sesbania bispinosa]